MAIDFCIRSQNRKASLSAVAMKALAVRREDRYQTVKELQLDLEAYQGGFATSAEHASAWKQAALLVKRHQKEAGLVVAAMGAASLVQALSLRQEAWQVEAVKSASTPPSTMSK